MNAPDLDDRDHLKSILEVAQIDSRELERRVIDRLRRRGAECLSHLAVEFDVSAKSMLAALQALESSGLIAKRLHRDLGARIRQEHSEDEERWAARR